MAEFNLFEHHHDHGHDHHEPPLLPEDLDPAQRSLADALRVCFNILKVVMVVLLVFYAFSGFFNVDSKSKAVRLRFGKILGVDEQAVLPPGGPYFAAPYPFEEHVVIPTTQMTLTLDKEFWYTLAPGEEDKKPEEIAGAHGTLNPETEGSLITGDANIVHAKWTVTYQVRDKGSATERQRDIVDYLQNVGDLAKAEDMVRNAAQEGAIYLAAQRTADHIVAGLNADDYRVAMAYMQKSLDDMHTGLEVTQLSSHTAMPLSVTEAYNAVSGALGEKGRLIEEAKQKQTQILGEAAGEGWKQLLELVEDYEHASDLTNQAQRTKELKVIDARLDNAFNNLTIGSKGNLKLIGGQVAQIINDAKTYRAQTVDQLSSEAERFNALLPQYISNPAIVLNRLWADAHEEIMTSPDIETFYLPRNGQVYLELSRDPNVQNRLDKQRLERQTEKNKAAAAKQANP